MEPIQLEFTPTKGDFVGGYMAYILNSYNSFLLLLPLFVVFLLCGLFWLIQGLVDGSISIIDSIPILLLPVILILVFALQPLLLWIRVARNERLRGLNAFTFEEERWSVKTPYSEGSADWQTFHRLIETPRYFLLVHSANKRMFNFIPKRAFTSPAQMNDFRALALSKIRGRPADRKVLPPWAVVLLGTAAVGCLIMLAMIILLVFPRLIR